MKNTHAMLNRSRKFISYNLKFTYKKTLRKLRGYKIKRVHVEILEQILYLIGKY